MYTITIIFSYKFKIVNNKEKPSTTGKLTNGGNKDGSVRAHDDIELHLR